MQSAKSAVFFLQVCNHNGLCKYRFDWSGKAEMATKYITLVTNKQTNKLLTHFLYYLSGAYSNWEYNDKSPENFCEYTPFMFAFVILILFWVLFGIGIFTECVKGVIKHTGQI